MKKNKKTITIIAVAVAAIGVMTASMFVYDWYKYNSENHKINNYIESLEGVDKSTISSDNYCTYSHQKYSKGVLGCNIDYTFLVDRSFTFSNDELSKELGWKYAFDNTTSVNRYSDKNYLKHVVFETGGMTCSYSIIDKQDTLSYQLGCSGPAKAEWFPVREN